VWKDNRKTAMAAKSFGVSVKEILVLAHIAHGITSPTP
jgi:hypothetical protein